jgi:hypothetical protein
MMDRDSTTRTGAKDPWGREGRPPAQRHVEASTVLDTEPRLLLWRKRAKGRSKLRGSDRMPGAGLRLRACRKALSDMLALKPYWGKPAVRNFRGGNGNVGIIRSPVRAIALLDHGELRGNTTTQCRLRDELGGAKAQRRTASMTFMMPGCALQLFPGIRFKT